MTKAEGNRTEKPVPQSDLAVQEDVPAPARTDKLGTIDRAAGSRRLQREITAAGKTSTSSCAPWLRRLSADSTRACMGGGSRLGRCALQTRARCRLPCFNAVGWWDDWRERLRPLDCPCGIAAHRTPLSLPRARSGVSGARRSQGGDPGILRAGRLVL